jgi:hypothetical protein
VVDTKIAQKMKKDFVDNVKPTIKYNTKEKTDICARTMGTSAAICATQNVAGWSRANDLCFARTGLPEKELVTSDMANSVLNMMAKKMALDRGEMPADVLGAS